MNEAETGTEVVSLDLLYIYVNSDVTEIFQKLISGGGGGRFRYSRSTQRKKNQYFSPKLFKFQV